MNSILENSIKNIIDKYDDLFLNKKNVIGIGLGYSVTCCYTKVNVNLLKIA